LRGKFAVLLEAPPTGGATTGAQGQSLTAARTRLLREKGALGTISIISRARETVLAKKGLNFDVAERLRFLDVDTVNPAPPRPPTPDPLIGSSADGDAVLHRRGRHEAGFA
jgi:hypothetical protein